MDEKEDKELKVKIKVMRILAIYDKLIYGEVVNKRKMASLFVVNERTIQRDLDDIRAYFDNNKETKGNIEIKYNLSKKGYRITKNDDEFLNSEKILAISKILLDSRAFCKDELEDLVSALLGQVGTEQRKNIKQIIGNELLNFVPLKHNKKLLSTLWELSEYIRLKEIIEVDYVKMSGDKTIKLLEPVSIIFSEFYFYLIAYMPDKDFDSPTVYRVDRISS